MLLALALQLAVADVCPSVFIPGFDYSNACAAKWLLDQARSDWISASSNYLDDDQPMDQVKERWPGYRDAHNRYVDCVEEKGLELVLKRPASIALASEALQRCEAIFNLLRQVIDRYENLRLRYEVAGDLPSRLVRRLLQLMISEQKMRASY